MFKVGDVVRLKGGVKPQLVTQVSGWMLRTMYTGGTHPDLLEDWKKNPEYSQKPRKSRDYVLIENVKETAMNKVTYKIIGSIVCGDFLCKTSGGKYVLEFAGGSVKDFDPSILEEVVPYVVRTRNMKSGASYHVRIGKGFVSVGSILMDNEGYTYEVEEVGCTWYGAPKFVGQVLSVACKVGV